MSKIEIVQIEEKKDSDSRESSDDSEFAPSLMAAIREEIIESLDRTYGSDRQIELSVSVNEKKARIHSQTYLSGFWMPYSRDTYCKAYHKVKNKKILTPPPCPYLISKALSVVQKFIQENLPFEDHNTTITLVIKEGDIAGVRTQSHSKFSKNG